MNESIVISGMLYAGAAVLMLGVLWWVLQCVANWKVFTKAGEAGWKSIIPIVSGHTAYKIAWTPVMFWIGLVLNVISEYAAQTYEQNEVTMWAVVMVIALVISTVINILFCLKLAKAFGKGTGFAIGLILLHPIFLLILGLGDAKYQGK